jgi:hypothetical protein
MMASRAGDTYNFDLAEAALATDAPVFLQIQNNCLYFNLRFYINIFYTNCMPPLKLLNDDELLKSTQVLVQRERECTTEILRHLQELERRKLYSDLQCGSLFEYAVKVLGYSEAAAGRRIAAMRLLAEIPEVADKLESGALNLAKLCQAQTYFRSVRQAEPQQALNTEQKKAVLEKLEEKSTREAEKILLEMGGPKILPREQMRAVSAEHTEVRFLIHEELREKLAEVRSLLGPKGGHLGLAELVLEMAKLAAEKLAEKKFGKRRVQQAPTEPRQAAEDAQTRSDRGHKTHPSDSGAESDSLFLVGSAAGKACQDDSPASSLQSSNLSRSDSPQSSRRTRYISQATQHAVWHAAAGQCTHCGSKQNLQFDHCEPFALGGDSQTDNLRLLCRSCNLRRGIKTFGTHAMRRG